jgi:hypothetical protein
MKQKSREALARAAGILTGLSFSIIKGGGDEALAMALKIINDVLSAEEERKEEADE